MIFHTGLLEQSASDCRVKYRWSHSYMPMITQLNAHGDTVFRNVSKSYKFYKQRTCSKSLNGKLVSVKTTSTFVAMVREKHFKKGIFRSGKCQGICEICS